MVNRRRNSGKEALIAYHQSLYTLLKPLSNSKTIIIGIGNVLKGDDGLGPLVCEKLKAEKISAEVIDAATVPENYIGTIIKKAPQNLIIIDAIDFAAEPGTIGIFELEQLDSYVLSTHSLSPRIFADMIRQGIEPDIYFIGVQPEHLELMSPVSHKVNNAIDDLSSILKNIFQPRYQQ